MTNSDKKTSKPKCPTLKHPKTIKFYLNLLFLKQSIYSTAYSTQPMLVTFSACFVDCVKLPHIVQWGLLVAPAALEWCGTPSPTSSVSSG